ncbi:MAG: hypothetical protein AAF293_03680 [Pseudomonadota bacterium]
MTETALNPILSKTRFFLAPRIGALLIFSLAVAASVFLSLTSSTPNYARATYSIWPALILGGWAIWLWVWGHPEFKTPLWKFTWLLGFLGYAIHFYFAMQTVFAWNIASVFAAQGAVVTIANLLLLVVWFLSVVMAYLGLRFPYLHRFAMLLFIAAAVASTLLFAQETLSYLAGVAIVASWLSALLLRRV